jgi:hypothetical protein
VKQRICNKKDVRGDREVTFRPRNSYILALLLALLAVPVSAADTQFATALDPVAFDNSTVKNTVGTGTVTGTLSGSTLTVSGNYSGLSSDATAAHLVMGLAFGVAGNATGGMAGAAVGDLKVSGGASGQAKALGQGAIYILVTSTKAPNGNLWGWLHLPDNN